MAVSIPTGSSYLDLPFWTKNKKACMNIQNDDNKCFMYAVQCGVQEIYKKPHPERTSHYDNDEFKKTYQQFKVSILNTVLFLWKQMMMKLMKLRKR